MNWNKLENWIFYIFLFVIPISLRHIFWFEPFNFVEWTAVYVYVTDLLLITLLLFWAIERWRPVLFHPVAEGGPAKLGKPDGLPAGRQGLVSWVWGKEYGSRATIILWLFVAVAFISIRNALDVQTAIFGWIKLVEGVALYLYIKNYALKRFRLTHAFEAIVAGAVFQSVIAIAQFMTQGSLGLKYLGESPLAPAMSGIAAFFVDGLKIMRAYGTTPHSNVLALYLFIALGAFYTIAIYKKRDWFWHVAHAVILWAFFLTFSRVIIGVWALGCILATCVFKPRPRKPVPSVSPASLGPLPLLGLNTQVANHNVRKIFWMTIAVGVLFVAVYWPYVANRSVISSNDEAIQLRVLYNRESLTTGQNTFGIGMGNFVPWLMTQNLHLNREVYQPVHNIYLLIYSETGIVGLMLFLLFLASLLYNFYKRPKPERLRHFLLGLIMISVLIFGLFDHYLWTIQSGRLIFWLMLGLLAG